MSREVVAREATFDKLPTRRTESDPNVHTTAWPQQGAADPCAIVTDNRRLAHGEFQSPLRAYGGGASRCPIVWLGSEEEKAHRGGFRGRSPSAVLGPEANNSCP